LAMYLEPFKAAAGEGAALELKMRLVAGKIPALQKYAHQRDLLEIETDILKEFDASLTADEKETLRLSRQLRNKVLHSDFRAARKKLNELGLQTESPGTRKDCSACGHHRGSFQENCCEQNWNGRHACNRDGVLGGVWLVA